MNNIKLTGNAASAFLKEAQQRGCYTAQQSGQIEGVWNLISKLLEKTQEDLLKMTIEELLARYPALLHDYGATTDTKPGTIQTYKSRLKAFLDDFNNWNGGDYMKWKEQNAKKSTSRIKKVKAILPPPEPPVSNHQPEIFQIYEIKMGPVLLGTVSVLPGLEKSDFEVFWSKVLAKKAEMEAKLTDAVEMKEASSG
jgi:hypothetical protein